MHWQVESSGNGLTLRRLIEPLGADLVRMAQQYTVKRQYNGFLVTGPHWIWSVVHVLRGTPGFEADGKVVHAPSPRFCLFAPPYSVVRFVWARCEVDSDGVLSRAPLGDIAPSRPVLLDDRERTPPRTVAGIETRLRSSARRIGIGVNAPTGSLASGIKAAIDAESDSTGSLARIASNLRIAPETLSRCFKKAFGLRPVEYRRRLQVMSALASMTGGRPIADAAYESGFEDLSSFYRGFRSIVRAAPSRYRAKARP